MRRKKQPRGLFKPKQEWDVPLRYLGDWHKQPGYMIAPSGGDLQTALDWLYDPENNADWLLVPIVTLDHPATVDTDSATVNYTVVPMGDGTAHACGLVVCACGRAYVPADEPHHLPG